MLRFDEIKSISWEDTLFFVIEIHRSIYLFIFLQLPSVQNAGGRRSVQQNVHVFFPTVGPPAGTAFVKEWLQHSMFYKQRSYYVRIFI